MWKRKRNKKNSIANWITLNKFNCEGKKKKTKTKIFQLQAGQVWFLKRKREERDCGKRDDNEVEDDESWGAIIVFSNG